MNLKTCQLFPLHTNQYGSSSVKPLYFTQFAKDAGWVLRDNPGMNTETRLKLGGSNFSFCPQVFRVSQCVVVFTACDKTSCAYWFEVVAKNSVQPVQTMKASGSYYAELVLSLFARDEHCSLKPLWQIVVLVLRQMFCQITYVDVSHDRFKSTGLVRDEAWTSSKSII